MDAVEAEAGNSVVTNDNEAIPGSVVWTAYARDADGNIKLFRKAFLFEQEQEHHGDARQPGTDYTISLPGTLTVIALGLAVVLLAVL